MNPELKKLLLRFLLPLAAGLAVTFLVLDTLTLRFLVFDSSVSGAYKVHRILEQHPSSEIPVIGTSRAKCCVIPDSLSGRVFNYGLNGADIGVVAFFLRQALDTTDEGTPVIVVVDPDWWNDGIGDPANWIPNAEHQEVRTIMGDAFQPRHRVPFVRHFGLFDKYASDRLKERISATEIVSKGSGLLKGSVGAGRLAAMAEATAGSSVMSFWTADRDKLDALLDPVRAHPDHTVIFVVAPLHPAYFEGKSESDIRTATGWWLELSEPAHAHLLDLSRASFDDSEYFDLKHLNERGARRFSRMLAFGIDSVLVRPGPVSDP